jgi:uncharacterized phiE125 gp8 family phage protein
MALNADALISLADFKTFSNISGSDHDTILEMLINQASAWIRRHIGRNLIQTTYTEYYNGHGERDLKLRNRPIVSVSNLYDDSARAFGSSSEIAVATNVLISKEAGIITLWNTAGVFSRGRANIKVIYSAGYALASIPADVQMAVCRTVDKHYRAGYTNRALDVSSETEGERTTTHAGPDLSKDVKALLLPFRKVDWAPQFSHAD